MSYKLQFFAILLHLFLLFDFSNQEICGNVDQPKLMFDKMPLNRTVIIGEHFELECDITSSPQPKIIWKMGDKIVQIIELGLVALVVVEMNTIKTKLFIPCADKTRIGEYTCMAFNGCNDGIESKAYVDVAGYPMINTNCPINQHTAPVIIAWTDARLEYMHATVHLICRAVGNPMPKIEWYRLDDNERRHPLSDEIMLKSGDLLIPASSSDSSNADDALVYANRQRRGISDGLGKRDGACFYECVARNIYGIDAKIVMLYATDK